MEPTSIIREIGGGLAAVVIVAEAIVIIALYRQVTSLSDKLLNLALTLTKEVSTLTLSTTQAVTALQTSVTTALKALRKEDRD